MRTGAFVFSAAAAALLLIPGIGRAETWSVPGDFSTIQRAVNSNQVEDGDEIVVGPGYFAGARITKSLIIRGSGSTYIIEGLKPWKSRPFNAGFLFRGKKAENGSGTKISNFIFQDVDFPVFASQRGAVVSDVEVSDCTMENSIQAITMWHADGWNVHDNTIIDLEAVHGGGIGILVGSYSGDDAYENRIADNSIIGTVYVDPEDRGGYNAAGIFIVCDRRGKNRGGSVEGNLVQYNRISLVSDTPDVVPVVAVELSDPTGRKQAVSVVENQVTENDLGETPTGVLLEGKKLERVNNVQ